MEHCTLHAVDGAIGTVEALYFDEVNWAVRYLLVDTKDWLMGRRVLISPVAVGEVRAEEQTMFIELTRAQIETSPPLDTDQPVSRRYEEAYYRHYNWPVYWEEDRQSGVAPAQRVLQKKRLQGTARVEGCVVVAADGAIGAVRDIFVDIRYWIIRYLEIEIRGDRPGRHVLVSTGWIERVNWADRIVNIDLACVAIDTAPGYDASRGISRDYEAGLFRHYGRRGYWQRGDGMN
ncbi:MAG: PRC-barrel domain-containing protein [Gammaproteobacteria bacterium]